MKLRPYLITDPVEGNEPVAIAQAPSPEAACALWTDCTGVSCVEAEEVGGGEHVTSLLALPWIDYPLDDPEGRDRIVEYALDLRLTPAEADDYYTKADAATTRVPIRDLCDCAKDKWCILTTRETWERKLDDSIPYHVVSDENRVFYELLELEHQHSKRRISEQAEALVESLKLQLRALLEQYAPDKEEVA